MKEKICSECGITFVGRRQSRYCSSLCTFWSMFDKSGGPDACWPWKGYRNEDGYGIVRGDLALKLLPQIGVKKRKLAHRLAYQLHFEVDPGELRVAHECDNPPCGNPSHLL